MTTTQGGLWDDVPEQLGHELPADVRLPPERLRVLHRMYGAGPTGGRCKTCANLIAKAYARTYYKCALVADSGGPGTDWRLHWPACGRWTPEEG